MISTDWPSSVPQLECSRTLPQRGSPGSEQSPAIPVFPPEATVPALQEEGWCLERHKGSFCSG